MAAIHVVKISESILHYFRSCMDFDNENEQFKKDAEKEFKEKLTKALNCGPATKEIVWVK